MRCLIVDDDEGWQNALKEELEALGFTRFSFAKNETEAIQAILGAEKTDDFFRLITLDRQLTEITGTARLSLLDLLKKYLQRRQGRTYCIVISGTSSESDVRDYFKKYGVYDFIAKHDIDFCLKLRQTVIDLFFDDAGFFDHTPEKNSSRTLGM